MQTDDYQQTYQLHESTPLAVAEMRECQLELKSYSVPPQMWPRRKATMLKWQGIEFWILKLKLHSYIACKVVGAGVGGWHGYWPLYASQGIGPSRRSKSSLGPSWEWWHHHYHKSP